LSAGVSRSNRFHNSNLPDWI